MNNFGMLVNKKFLTLVLTTESAELATDLNSFQELFKFLARYAFIDDKTSSESENLKRQNPSRGELFFKNPNGARYLDPKYSRWISVDPALSEYIPVAGKATVDGSGKLEGQGGAFNYVNLNLYHYAENNPIKYTDPDGRSGKLTIYSQRGVNSLIPKTDENGCVIVNENGEELYPSSLFFGNHSWISFTDDETGVTTYYGTWGHDTGGNLGLRVNDATEKYEAEHSLAGEDLNIEYRTVQIDDTQQAKLEEYNRKNGKKRS